ncbi:hypothetical protein [Acidovorax sp. BL-A-41-H1]|uniref:hypothetical protein n=1 Tax=Acidovorax sp. BL-A-41-H1 TaxID=3421102 RepID=UPI003F7AC8A5
MTYFPALLGLVTIIALLVFFWKRSGFGSSRNLAHGIAKHIGIQRGLFYSILDHGTMDSSRKLLASLARSEMGVEAASVELGPTLLKGVERLEAHFGVQDSVTDARPKIQRLIAVQDAGSQVETNA